jgi:hypothetical protein
MHSPFPIEQWSSAEETDTNTLDGEQIHLAMVLFPHFGIARVEVVSSKTNCRYQEEVGLPQIVYWIFLYLVDSLL